MVWQHPAYTQPQHPGTAQPQQPGYYARPMMPGYGMPPTMGYSQPMSVPLPTMPRGGGNNKPVQLKPALPHQPNEMVVQQARVDTKKTGLSQHVTPVAANGKQAPVPKPASTNVAVALPALPSVTSFKIKSKDAAANSRWGKEPATAAEKVKELQQSVQKSEKQKQQLQKTVAEFESKAQLAEKREQLMSARLHSSSGEVGQLKLDFDMLKGEVIHAHQELQTVAEENAKLKALGYQSEQALMQAAEALKKYETSRAKEVNKHQGERVVHLSELKSVQSELDQMRPQMTSAKSALISLKSELKSKESQLKDTMAFNKKSMSITAKLNDCVKLQEKELNDLKWTKGMQQNELKEKALKIGALQALQDSRQAVPAPAPAPAHLREELASKDNEIEKLKKALEESKQQVSSMKQLRDRQIQIPWNAATLGATAREYISQLAGRGVKRKATDLHVEDAAEATKLNKHAIRNVMLTDADLEKEMNSAMSHQQSSVSKAQRNLLQAQKALRDAQEARDANYTRKRCVEARAKVCRAAELPHCLTASVDLLSAIKLL